eukprot:364606-Chlamydomonas_euryale.AAC.5
MHESWMHAHARMKAWHIRSTHAPSIPPPHCLHPWPHHTYLEHAAFDNVQLCRGWAHVPLLDEDLPSRYAALVCVGHNLLLRKNVQLTEQQQVAQRVLRGAENTGVTRRLWCDGPGVGAEAPGVGRDMSAWHVRQVCAKAHPHGQHPPTSQQQDAAHGSQTHQKKLVVLDRGLGSPWRRPTIRGAGFASHDRIDAPARNLCPHRLHVRRPRPSRHGCILVLSADDR